MTSGDNPISINLPDFFGNINIIEPSSFAFSLGEREQILQVTLYCDEIVTKAKNGEVFFDGKNKITYIGTVVYQKLGRFFSNKNFPMLNESKLRTQSSTLSFSLYQKILNVFQSLVNIEQNVLETFNENMVSIRTKNDKTTGYVKCILCIEDKIPSKTTDFSIGSKMKGNKCYWITSNFSDHIKKMHKIRLKQKTDDAIPMKVMPIDNPVVKQTKNEPCTNNIQASKSVETSNSQSFELIELNTSKLSSSKESSMLENYNFEISTIVEVPHTSNSQSDQVNEIALSRGIESNSKMSIPENPIMQKIYTIDEPQGSNLQSIIYKQITNQLMSLEFFTVNTEAEKDMVFDCEGEKYILQTIDIPKDGNCMYRAIVHQLHDVVRSANVDAKTQAGELRTEVMSFIQENKSHFKMHLLGQFYDKFPDKSEIGTKDDQCSEMISILFKDGQWGGSETLHAVVLLYKVNILILNEGGDCYFFNGFDVSTNRTIILAYRFIKDEKSEYSSRQRSHYESVVSINSEYVFSLAQMIATRMEKKIELKPNEVVLI